jgi:hypothetical protein
VTFVLLHTADQRGRAAVARLSVPAARLRRRFRDCSATRFRDSCCHALARHAMPREILHRRAVFRAPFSRVGVPHERLYAALGHNMRTSRRGMAIACLGEAADVRIETTSCSPRRRRAAWERSRSSTRSRPFALITIRSLTSPRPDERPYAPAASPVSNDGGDARGVACAPRNSTVESKNSARPADHRQRPLQRC